jgi:hypothetical protein
MFQVPYPNDSTYDPTRTTDVCDVLKALTVFVDGPKGDEETYAEVTSPTVAAMEAVCAGDHDALLFGRYSTTTSGVLPKLKGNSDDSVTDLPLILQRELGHLTNTVNSSIQERKLFTVGGTHLVLACVRAAYPPTHPPTHPHTPPDNLPAVFYM